MMWSHLPRFKTAADSFREAMGAFRQGVEPPPEQWQPYYDEVAKDALEAAQRSERVVVSNWFQRREFRDYFRRLVGGDVEWVQLVCDEEEYLSRNFSRVCKQAEAQGKTPAQFWKDMGLEARVGGPLTREFYFEYKRPQFQRQMASFHEFQPAEGTCHTVDATARDVTVLDAVDAALGLPQRDAGVDIDQQRIAQVNLDRIIAFEASRAENQQAGSFFGK